MAMQAGPFGPLGMPAGGAAGMALRPPQAPAAAGTAACRGSLPGMPPALAAALSEAPANTLNSLQGLQHDPAMSAFAAVQWPSLPGGARAAAHVGAAGLGLAAGGPVAGLSGQQHLAALSGPQQLAAPSGSGSLSAPAEDGALDGRRMRQRVEGPEAGSTMPQQQQQSPPPPQQLPPPPQFSPSSSCALLPHPAMSALASLAAAPQGSAGVDLGGRGGDGGGGAVSLVTSLPSSTLIGGAFGAGAGVGAVPGPSGVLLGTSGPLSSEFLAAMTAVTAAGVQGQPCAGPLQLPPAVGAGAVPYAQHPPYSMGGGWPYGPLGSCGLQGWQGSYGLAPQTSFSG
jgi:hypothetical protein